MVEVVHMLIQRQTILAFSITALITFLLSWTLYICDAGFIAERNSDLQVADHYEPSVLDSRFRSFILFSLARRKKAPRLSDQWRHVLQRCMMASSDGHLITGMAIMLAAFSQATKITIYHFNVSVYLAWLSFSVHMVTVSICRPVLTDRPALLYWRLVAAGMLCTLLVSGIALTSSPQSPQNNRTLRYISSRAVPSPFFMDTAIMCTWSCGEMKTWPADNIVAMCLIALGFLTRCVRSVRSASQLWQHYTITLPASAIRALYLLCANQLILAEGFWRTVLWQSVLWGICCAYLNVRAIVDIFGSLLGEMYWLSILLAWGTSKLLIWRSVSPLSQFENEWGFGQVLPLLLLLAPFLAVPEMYMSHSRDLIKRAQRPIDGPVALSAPAALPRCQDMQQASCSSNRAALPSLLMSRSSAYQSRLYRFLIVCYLSGGIIWLTLIIGFSATDVQGGNPANPIQTVVNMPSFGIGAIIAPTFLGPAVLFSILLAPFSRTIWRAVTANRTLAVPQFPVNGGI